jgi:hypothetical protein
VSDIVLNSEDPIAFARVVQRIAETGPGLLVEPYFRLDDLMPIVYYTQVARVLTSERTKPTERDGLKLGVERLVLDRPFEVRVAGRELHDRYVIPEAGGAQFIGASLNRLGQVATAMGALHDGADRLRELYEELWTESSVLACAQQPPAPPADPSAIAS